jgi:hypothetical protein
MVRKTNTRANVCWSAMQEIGHNFGGNHPDAYPSSLGYTCSTNDDREPDRILRSDIPTCTRTFFSFYFVVIHFIWAIIRYLLEPRSVHLRLRDAEHQVQLAFVLLHVVVRCQQRRLAQSRPLHGTLRPIFFLFL